MWLTCHSRLLQLLGHRACVWGAEGWSIAWLWAGLVLTGDQWRPAQSAPWPSLGTGQARAHQLLNETPVRSAERRSSDKATMFLCKVVILFLYGQSNTFSGELGYAEMCNQTQSLVPFRADSSWPASRPSRPDTANQTRPTWPCRKDHGHGATGRSVMHPGDMLTAKIANRQ